MSKLTHITTSIFTVMSQMATQYNAINLAQGFPNFSIDPVLKDIISRVAKDDFHQYLPMSGYPPLLHQIEKLTLQSYGRKVDTSDEILITAGATEGIFASIQALVQSGDEVIILDPSYDCYETPVLLCNAKPIRVSLNADFTPNWEAIEAAFSHKTRLIITNNPHNPSGRIWTENDFMQLEYLLSTYQDAIVLSDEVYEYITFENIHISMHHRPKLIDKCVVVSSFGKSFHITGWKVGYLVAPKHLLSEIKKVHQFLVFSVNSVAQVALSEYLAQTDVSTLGSFYKEKRDYFKNLMQTSRFELLPCEGTYFQVASYQAISDENDIVFSTRLLKDYGVATIPLSPFFANGNDLNCVRFCFAKEHETLAKATELLVKL